jgi:hypothetical protein
MGTQQILLIVLSVIIVGVAIAVGINMFSSQAYNSNQQAVAAELANYASLVIQYWKTPASMGGGGQTAGRLTATNVANYIGFSGDNSSVTTDNGEFRVISVSGNVVTLKGLGKEMKGTDKPLCTTTIDVSSNVINTTVTKAANF